ncbi:MAG: glycosyltransferase [Dysgonamonadaceae bacterium]|jgi:glycosyltransferase involved in cell wall biosynthesis|nr:glycosyltransferase [Dysgonamonadaceae bacterium]
MKQRILFDGIATQSTAEVPFHGGGDYAKYVLKKAIELGYRNFDIVFSRKMIVDENIKNLINAADGIHIYYIDALKEVYAILETNKYDCFYSALAHIHKEYDLNILFIMVIHGMRSIELPWDEYRYKYYRGVLKRLFAFIITKSNILQKYLKRKHIKYMDGLIKVKNKKIITDSQHSKYALLYYFPKLNARDISVLYLPNFEFCEKIDNVDAQQNTYFLMISANRWEKNIYRAVEAFDILFSHNQLTDKHVVITGYSAACWSTRKIKNKDKFELLPYITESQLEDLYRRAFAFVYPSLNEGFGLPPLRAMQYGIPVIASSATSIPEVCGDAAIYFDPHSVGDLANRILQVTYDPAMYSLLVKNGIRQYQQYHTTEAIIKEVFD